MLKRHLRLCRSKDFEQLRQLGISYKHPVLTLSFISNRLTHNRYGFIVPKRFGKAVQRNRVKRQLREATRQLHPHLRMGYDLIFIVKQAALGKSTLYLQNVMTDLCRRAQLLSY